MGLDTTRGSSRNRSLEGVEGTGYDSVQVRLHHTILSHLLLLLYKPTIRVLTGDILSSPQSHLLTLGPDIRNAYCP